MNSSQDSRNKKININKEKIFLDEKDIKEDEQEKK